jgi:hypothetical protein
MKAIPVNTERYDTILKNLAEKRQMLRDQNRIDDECVIKEHIKRIIEQGDVMVIQRPDYVTIVRSLRYRAFIDRVMEQAATLFVRGD